MAHRVKLMDSEIPGDGAIIVFPEPLDMVLIPEDYPTRHVGEDTEYLIPAGTIATVAGNWEECCDTHLVMSDGAEVWCCPLDLKILTPFVLPEHVMQAGE